jgi:SAM-dependent methyltransferase
MLGGGESVLHLGAGRDSLEVVKALPRSPRVISVDLDRAGLASNPNPRRVVGDGGALPFRDGSFDLILSDNVFEHLEDPAGVLRSCRRCLRPGGALVFLTPNRYSYLSLFSRVTPYRVHVRLRGRMMGVAASDTFRTHYRLNSPRQLRRVAGETGFRLEILRSYVGWPTYWEFSDLLHRCFVVVHRFLEVLPAWAHITLVGVLRADE